MKYWPRRESLNHAATRTTQLYARVQGPGGPRPASGREVPGRTVPSAPTQRLRAGPVQGHLPGAPAPRFPGRRATPPGTPTHHRPGAVGRPPGSGIGDLKKSLPAHAWSGQRRREVVMSLTQHSPARLVCRLLDFPRCQLYRSPRDAGEEDAPLREALTRLAGEWPTYGYRRLTAMLRREGWAVNAKRVRRIMAALGLHGAAPGRRTRTTDSNHDFPRWPNRVQTLAVVRPHQVGGRHHVYPPPPGLRLLGGYHGCLYTLGPRLASRPQPRRRPDAHGPGAGTDPRPPADPPLRSGRAVCRQRLRATVA